MLRSLLRLLARRIVLAFTTLPTPAGWVEAGLLLAAYGLVALPLGLAGGFLKLTWATEPWPLLVLVAAGTFFLPGVFEETLFRVLLLPHLREAAPRWRVLLCGAVALTLFVLWHPWNAWLFAPAARPIFYNGVFLSLAGLLGLVCTVAYLRTGSVWPSVIIHWLAVIAWKLCLGGALLTFESP